MSEGIRRGSSGSCIPDDSADQPSVCGRNPVVFINVQLGEGTDLDFELALLRKRIA